MPNFVRVEAEKSDFIFKGMTTWNERRQLPGVLVLSLFCFRCAQGSRQASDPKTKQEQVPCCGFAFPPSHPPESESSPGPHLDCLGA